VWEVSRSRAILLQRRSKQAEGPALQVLLRCSVAEPDLTWLFRLAYPLSILDVTLWTILMMHELGLHAIAGFDCGRQSSRPIMPLARSARSFLYIIA
jgi:hypothetical protein